MSNDTIEYLKNIPPFKDLSDENLRSIDDNVTHVEFPQEIIIFDQGAEGDSMYIIKKGIVQVFIKEAETGEKIALSNLTEGDYFGEMALLTGEPRSASIETLSPVSLLRLDKTGFDKLINENPRISLSLSYMLSQRLKNTNIQLLESEKFYHSKISPSGSLREVPFDEILRFCEQNSLTGMLKLDQNDIHSEIQFVKGIAQKINMADLTDDEAMDQLMQWKEGNFVIEPSLFSMEDEIHPVSDTEPEDDPAEEVTPDKKSLGTQGVLEFLLKEVFQQLIAVVGTQSLNEINRDTKKQLEPYFPSLQNFKIDLQPQLTIDLNTEDDWDEKKTLAIAVYLQSILKTCQPLVVGMSFFDIRSIVAEYQTDLDKISFFEFMEHAKEFTV